MDGNHSQFLKKTQAVMKFLKENSFTLIPATNQWEMPLELSWLHALTCFPLTQKMHKPFPEARVAQT